MSQELQDRTNVTVTDKDEASPFPKVKEGEEKKSTKCKRCCVTCCFDISCCGCCIILTIVSIVITIVIAGAIWTSWNASLPYQTTFMLGKKPSNMNGFYYGSPVGFVLTSIVRLVPWKGKYFNITSNLGVNFVRDADNLYQKNPMFPFKTYYGKGALDPSKDVFKIDYNVPENAGWLKAVLDELVEIKPGYYIGKMQYIISPGNVWTLGYFELKE